MKLKFEASNNQAEYEALIVGVELALELGALKIVIHCDSQLVVKQILGEYDTINTHLAKYCELARNLLRNFEYWDFV